MSEWEEIIKESFIGSLWSEEFEELSYDKGALYLLTREEKKQVRSNVSWKEVEALVKRLAEDCGKKFDDLTPLLRLRVGNIGLVAMRYPYGRNSCTLMKMGCELPDWISDIREWDTLIQLKETHSKLGVKGEVFLVSKFAVDIQTDKLKYIISTLVQSGNDMGVGAISYVVTKADIAQFFTKMDDDFDTYKQEVLGEIG
ncbi:hypothetical protein B4086_5667 [Bacillus cereus]|nr:hypothetical protein B4086_5667 [Bacillus cereus]